MMCNVIDCGTNMFLCISVNFVKLQNKRTGCLGGAAVRAFDFRPSGPCGRGFDSRSGVIRAPGQLNLPSLQG